MNDTIMIKASERARRAFASATRYQREVALRRFVETLETPEQELLPNGEEIEAMFGRLDRHYRENNIPPIENLDELLAKFDAGERRRIAEMGDEAYIAELDSLQNGEVYKDSDGSESS